MAVAVRPEANPFVDFVRLYATDPVAFVREVLGGSPDANQCAVMEAVARGDRQIAIRSGHRVGKTTTLAWLIVWHNVTHFPQKTLCTAATAPQLFDALVPETKTWFTRLPSVLYELFDVKAESIALLAAPTESFTSFTTARPETPEALAGKHSEGFILLIADEASGVHEAVYESASGSMASPNAVMILAGNPIRSSGTFFDAFHKLRDLWTTFHISCIGHPRISPAWVEEQRRKFGEDSNAFRGRVLGEFPKADDDTIIAYELAEAALHREVDANPQAAVVWGVDCARFGSDKSTLAKRRANVLLEPVDEWGGLDTMATAGRVHLAWKDCDPKDRPREINIDVIGIGAGVYDRLNELGLPVRAINVSETAAESERYANLRTELWFKGRDWFAAKDCNIAGDEGLMAEAVPQKYRYRSNGKLEALSKDEMKALGFPSPNKADAFLLTLASDHITLAHGSAMSADRHTPLKRAIRGIV